MGRTLVVHPYSTDERRVSVYAGLAVVSVIVSWGLVAITSGLAWPQWLISPPSLAGSFAALYAIFDRYLWRLPVFHWLGLARIKDIGGIYEGNLISTFRDGEGSATQRAINIRVTQTWTRISVEMVVISGESSSESVSALGSVTRDGQSTRLIYVYRNRVNPGLADADMGDHEGAADLRIDTDGTVSGRYFNSRPRAGTIRAHLMN